MKKRSPITVFFLSIITLGIYDLYWLAKTKKVLNEKTKFHTPSIWLLIAPVILLAFGYIYLIVASFDTTVNSTSSSYGAANQTSSSHLFLATASIFIGFIALFIVSFIWFFKFSKAVNAYTQGKMSTAIAFLILYLVHLIGVAIIQDTFNDIIDAGQEGGQPQPVPQNAYSQAPIDPNHPGTFASQAPPQPPAPASETPPSHPMDQTPPAAS